MIRMREYVDRHLQRKPRASGDDPQYSEMVDGRPDVNPARAGMIRICHVGRVTGLRKPRASGDDPGTSEIFGNQNS